MLIKLLKHSWQNFWRSPFVGEKIFLIVLKLILFFSFALTLFGILGISELLINEGKLQVTIHEIGALVLVYVLFDWVIRYLLQSFPETKLTPYLALPIGRQTIVKSIIIRSFLSVFFFVPFLVLLPLNIFLSRHFEGSIELFNLNLFLIGSSLFNHFLLLFVKYKARKHQYIPYIFIAVLVILTFFQMKEWINLAPVFISVSEFIFSRLFISVLPFVLLVPLVIMIGNSFLQFLKVERQENINEKILPIQLFSNYGKLGQIIDFELNMMTRLKATRGFLLFGLIWIAYPLLLGLNSDTVSIPFMVPLAAIFVSFGMVQLAQFALAWHTYHFDAILLQQQPERLLKGKWIAFTLIGLIFTFMGIVFYAFVAPWFIPYLIVGFLYNVGFTTPITLYLGIKYPRTKDPYSGNVFRSEINFQPEMLIYGLVMVAGIFIPFYLGKLIVQADWAGIMFIFLFSLLCLAFYQKVLKELVNVFQQAKYKVYQKFRAFAHD